MKQQGSKIAVSTDDIVTIMLGRNTFGEFGKTSEEALKPEIDLVHYQSPQLSFCEDTILEGDKLKY